ncbi:MAG: hypothetical protein WBD28_02010 [Candidatus Zixiibacteriota bacterium]
MALFGQKDIQKIAACLETTMEREKDHFRLKIKSEKRTLILEIYPSVKLGKKEGSLVVVYTPSSHLQLHNCSGYVISEELGEVTFVGETKEKISGLVVERKAACALYANVKRELISGDFTKLGIEVMLSGVALSLAEEILEKSQKGDS